MSTGEPTVPPTSPSSSSTRSRLSRERILDAALSLVDAQGLDSLTMRELGRLLDVEAMSLYRYFPNKAALLEALGERIIAEIELPSTHDADWEELVTAGLRSFWHTLRAHPNAAPLLTITPTISPPAMAAAELLLEVLGRAGIPPAEAHGAFRVLQAFTVGTAVMAAARPSVEEVRIRTAAIGDLERRFPLLGEALPAVTRATADDDFELGLALLLASLRQRIRARAEL